MSWAIYDEKGSVPQLCIYLVFRYLDRYLVLAEIGQHITSEVEVTFYMVKKERTYIGLVDVKKLESQ